MDNLESKPALDPAPERAELTQQVESVRQLVISALVLMVVISGTLNIFLLRQVQYARADLKAFRTQAAQILGDYERTKAPVMREFLSRLVEFGKSPRADEGFAAIMRKYNVVGATGLTNAPGTAAPTSSAAPSQVPPKK